MKRIKMKLAMVLAMIMALVAPVTVFASTTPPIDVASVLGTGMTTVAGEIMGVIAVILPIALGVVGAVIAIRKGIGLMRGLVR
jgi:flagellar biosynthesis protein FliR